MAAFAGTTVQVDSQEQATFTFDNVVGPNSSQEDIFEGQNRVYWPEGRLHENRQL